MLKSNRTKLNARLRARARAIMARAIIALTKANFVR